MSMQQPMSPQIMQLLQALQAQGGAPQGAPGAPDPMGGQQQGGAMQGGPDPLQALLGGGGQGQPDMAAGGIDPQMLMALIPHLLEMLGMSQPQGSAPQQQQGPPGIQAQLGQQGLGIR